jgi:cytochrome c553
MRIPVVVLTLLASLSPSAAVFAAEPDAAAREIEKALDLTPNLDRGRRAYLVCAVCHMPEGWGREDGDYPQIAGQHYSVIIKQLADIRARNRDTPTMLPFAMLENLSLQEMADVSAYISRLPMTPDNGVGPGTNLARGEALYGEYCAECHGDRGEGIAEKHMPRIQGQHYRYLVRQFEWIRDGKRRNGDEEMAQQARELSRADVEAVMDYVSRLRPAQGMVAPSGWRNPDFPSFARNEESDASD